MYFRHRKPNSEFLYKALYSILSSDRPNDDISGEVADIIGFEDIDLAMEILNYRVPILQEVRFFYIVCKKRSMLSKTYVRLDSSTKTCFYSRRKVMLPFADYRFKRCHLLMLLLASDAHYLSASMAQRRMEKKFEDNAARPLFSGTMVSISP